MKKIVSIAIMLLFSLSCMADDKHHPTIAINNNTDTKIEVSDRDGHNVSVEPNQSADLSVRLIEQHGSFPIPSSLLTYVTTITVRDGKRSRSIKIDESTSGITIDKGLKLKKEKS